MMIRCHVVAVAAVGFALAGASQAQDAAPAPTRYVSPYLMSIETMMLLSTGEAAKKAKAARKFTVTDAMAPYVMGKTQSILSDWRDGGRASAIMKIQNVNDNFIDTYQPTALGEYGMNVSCVKVAGGRQIVIQGKAYEGNIFGTSQEHKEADKRADLLAFLLQEYVKELESDPSLLQPAAPKSKLRPEIEAMLTTIRALIEANQTDAAISQMDILKTMLQKTAPPLIVEQPTGGKPK